MAFDCLYLEGRDLRPLPLHERPTDLGRVVESDHTLILLARHLAANGLEAWARAVRAGYEGMVAKNNVPPYRGGRTLSWLKIKQPTTAKASAVGSHRGKRSPHAAVLV
jgi:bifunctional non-homologous end joining protein LigD